MGTLLRLDASSRNEGSHSRALCDYFIERWRDRHTEDRIVHRDLAATPVPHIAARTIEGFYTPPEQFTPELRRATALSDTLIGELKAADTVLISVPIYNFTIPSALKAYIDHIVRIGHTFDYDGSNFTGLLTGKRAFVFCAYGAGGYLNNGPLAGFDFLQPYMKLLLGFLGIGETRFFAVENTTGETAALSVGLARAHNEIDQAIAACSHPQSATRGEDE